MIKNKYNILIFRIIIITIGIIVLVSSLHLSNSSSSLDVIGTVKIEQHELAQNLSERYNAAILKYKLNQHELINKIMPLKKVVVADSVVKDFYQKGKDVFIILKINNSSTNIYAKLKCSYSAIKEYFKLKSNKVFVVFEVAETLNHQPFYELERIHGKPLILSGKREILITGKCLHVFDSPHVFLTS